MSYSEVKQYLDKKPGQLYPQEKEYINLNLKLESTNRLISIWQNLDKIAGLTKTEEEELKQARKILAQRLR